MYKVPKDNCPKCGKFCNAATALSDSKAAPVPGDLTVCIQCASILQFEEDMHLTVVDIESIDIEPKTKQLLLNAQRIVKHLTFK